MDPHLQLPLPQTFKAPLKPRLAADAVTTSRTTGRYHSNHNHHPTTQRPTEIPYQDVDTDSDVDLVLSPSPTSASRQRSSTTSSNNPSTNFLTPRLDSVDEPRSMSREWLHFVILDWINEYGQRVFPIPLKSVSSPVYAIWIGCHKEEIGDKALNILSEFLLNNQDYNEFGNLLIGSASKRWPEPRTVLEQGVCIPNFSEKSFPAAATYSNVPAAQPATSSDPSMASLIALARHSSPVVGTTGSSNSSSSSSMDSMKPIADMWNTVVGYLGMTQAGVSLSARLRLLIQAKAGLKDGMKQLEPKSSFHYNPVMGNNHNMQQLTNLTATLDRLINTVEVQVALLRESIEIAIFLIIQSSDVDYKNAFASDYASRKMFMEKLSLTHKSQYTRIRNVQALMYLLQWRLLESPTKLFDVLKDLVDAVVRDDFPVPGLGLLACPSLSAKIVEEEFNMLLGRIKDAVYCRRRIAVKLLHPELLEDFVSKYLLMILTAQQRRVQGKDDPRFMAEGLDHNHSRVVVLLLKGIPTLLFELHVAAHEFKTAHVQKASRAADAFNWDLDWWSWPMHVIRNQLRIADNFIGASSEGELDEQNQLPIVKTLIGSYQEMMGRASHSRPADLQHLHFWIILLNIQEAWLHQLIGMSSSFPFIHLLDEEEQSRKCAPTELEARCEKPLLEKFCNSPSKVQGVYNKCAEAMRCCQAAVIYCRDWFLANSATIDHILDDNDENSFEDTAAQVNYYVTLRASRRNLLSSLEWLQHHRLPILLQYQRILQRLGSCSPSSSGQSFRNGNRYL